MATAVSFEQVSFSYGDQLLLDNASLTVNEQDKIGIVGLNGAGKSTMLKLITRSILPDKGSVSLKSGITISSLSQIPHFDKNATLLSYVSNFTQETYEAAAMLTRLGFTDLSLPISTLSGGQQKRAALAATLIQKSALLLLDEPTNHMDSDMIEWLENWLQNYRGTLMMVTHDRYFLDRVCNHMIEVTHGKIERYIGNYASYLTQKAAREEMAQASLRKKESLFKTELEWMQRGARARSTKAKGRIEKFEALKDTLAPEKKQDDIQLASAASRLGKKILSLHNVQKALGGHVLIKNFSYTLLRDDRLGIIGANGAGKTTLLNLFAGDLSPDKGTIERGETLQIGYFKQHFPQMDESVRLIDAARNVSLHVVTPDGNLTAAQMLERFLFPASMHSLEVARLSGGEKRRLYLLQVLLTAPNILILDEPTNDLDIKTLTVLEDYLDSFQGAVITVTHDRYFLDRVTHHLFALENAELTPYHDYASYHANKMPSPPKELQKKEATVRPQREKTRFTFKEQRDFETIEQRIEAIESKLASILNDIDANSSDYQKVSELMQMQANTEKELDEAMERFLYLQELFDSFDKA